MDDVKEWKVYMLVAKFLRDVLWRYHREKRVVKGKLEKLVKRNRRGGVTNLYNRDAPRAVEKQAEANSRNFWDSIPMGDLSPEQRKYLKTIMKKEVRL